MYFRIIPSGRTTQNEMANKLMNSHGNYFLFKVLTVTLVTARIAAHL